MNVIDKIPMTITNYLCLKCGKWHKRGSRPFEAHYTDTFDSNGCYRKVYPKVANDRS